MLRNYLERISRMFTTRTKGWGPVAAVLVTFGIYFGSQLFAGVAVGIYAEIQHIDIDKVVSTLDKSAVSQFAYILFIEVVSLWLLWTFMKRRSISWKMIGLKKTSLNKLLYAIPALVVYFLILIITLSFVGQLIPSINLDQNQDIGFDGTQGPALILVFASLVLLPAFVEEILVRGFLYGGLRNRLPKITSAIIASLIFGMAHLQLGNGAPALWVAAIDTFILSLVLIWLREKTGSIWAGVGVHMAKNSLAFMSIFVFSFLH